MSIWNEKRKVNGVLIHHGDLVEITFLERKNGEELENKVLAQVDFLYDGGGEPMFNDIISRDPELEDWAYSLNVDEDGYSPYIKEIKVVKPANFQKIVEEQYSSWMI